MSIHSHLIARYNLSGPEEFCNTIAQNEAGLRWRLERLREVRESAKSHYVPMDAMTHKTIRLIEDVISDLDEQADTQLHVLAMDGYPVRKTVEDLDTLYEFLLDTETPGSRYIHHMGALMRFIKQLSQLDSVLSLELQRFKHKPQSIQDDLLL